MCGIAGLVGRPGERVDEALLAAMTDTLRHRGPDASGLLLRENVGLGHRRLAVIDLAREADQPLANEDGTVQVILNGELYNFQSLRAELEACGHRFKTDHSDTEVLAHGWEEWGPALVPRLRGMFAFVLADFGRRKLFLARDRFGKKPFYYRTGRERFAFASEIKALARLPELSRELDLAALGEYMVYGNTAGDHSIYREIRRLPAAHTLTLDLDGSPEEARVERYWRFEPRPEEALEEGPFLEELEAVLSEAVRLRLIADVPLGAFLSGGIDSSLVVALMAKHASGPVKTFAIGFAEAEWDESAHARAVAEHLGTEHHCEIVTPDALSALPELVATYDEPFADPSAIPTYYLSRMTRRHVTVALSGDGGDELFFGYDRYRASARLAQLSKLATPLGRAAAGAASRLFPPCSYLRRALSRGSLEGFDLYHHALGFAPDYLALLGPEVRSALGDSRQQKAAADFFRVPGLPFLDRCRDADLENYLTDHVLVKVDRASMRFSLEVRCPLLDHEVAELAARAPGRLQMRAGEQKVLLRRLAYRYVPQRLIDRPKMGFGVPISRWLRRELAPSLEAVLGDERHPAWRYLDRKVAGRYFEVHRSGRGDCQYPLWRLLFFARWAEARGLSG
ncbi:MAG: asparagine synthase (glutamine-hydrolyzing) [Thermoanaerobaculia bacterium]